MLVLCAGIKSCCDLIDNEIDRVSKNRDGVMNQFFVVS